MKAQLVALLLVGLAAHGSQPVKTCSRVFEWTFESRKSYPDPFNDVDVDVIFTNSSGTWRVPAFWRGENRWTVRFAPPAAGEFAYRLESSDTGNSDINGHAGRVVITPYGGVSALLRRGPLRVSSSRRYFEHADGTPFYWLGDTCYPALSDRLSWEAFRQLTGDRMSKGFTTMHISSGLVPDDELAPTDPGSHNEGGTVWDSQLRQINPRFFDYADRRVRYLVESGIVPAIIGGWGPILKQMGVAKLKKHWRYIIARYGAYPVFWILGGEVYDPPENSIPPASDTIGTSSRMIGWTDVARYVRATDPYHHPLTSHEFPPPYDLPLQDESLTDFDLFQSGHWGWSGIAVAISQLNMHWARTTVTKPVVMGEIGYENIGGTHLADFQRAAFWISMLNGAAGYTYGANGVFSAYTADKPFQRFWKWSFKTWDEAMSFPGSYEVGLGSHLIRAYDWWRFEPHPEWVTPRGTTILEPRTSSSGFDIGTFATFFTADFAQPLEGGEYPGGEWKAHQGTFRLPYATGIPGDVRLIYIPSFTAWSRTPPTVLGLERGVRYHGYYWEPELGIKIDLGSVEQPGTGPVIISDTLGDRHARPTWAEYGAKTIQQADNLTASADTLTVLAQVDHPDLVAAVDAQSDTDASLVLRFHDPDNYFSAVYAPQDKSLYLLDRRGGADGQRLASMNVTNLGPRVRLTAEVRHGWAAACVSDGKHSYTSGIVSIQNREAGSVGLKHRQDGGVQRFANFEVRKSVPVHNDERMETSLYDANGKYRGEMKGPGWQDFRNEKILLLDGYRPPDLPVPQDWVLVLERAH